MKQQDRIIRKIGKVEEEENANNGQAKKKTAIERKNKEGKVNKRKYSKRNIKTK